MAEANRSGADIYISIHQNATEEGVSANGMEVWYTEDDGRTDSKRLAQLIRQQTLKSTEATERELRSDADFYVTKNTSMPACLIETGFLSNAGERRKLNLAEYQQQIAGGIVQGIAYLCTLTTDLPRKIPERCLKYCGREISRRHSFWWGRM